MARAPVLFLLDKKCPFSLNSQIEKSDYAILLLGTRASQIYKRLRNTCFF